MTRKAKLLKLFAIGIDVLVPLIVTLSYFPLWVNRSAEATVSGLAIVFALISFIPLIKVIKKRLASPSVWMVWVFIAVILIALNTIIDQAIVISVFGAIANCIGAIIYKIADRIEGE